MNKITLHRPNLCRFLLVLPVLLYLCISAVICFLLSSTPKVCLITGAGLFIVLLFLLSRYRMFHYLSTIFEIQKLLKEDSRNPSYQEPPKNRRPLYLIWHDQSLMEFIREQNELFKGYSSKAASLSKTMKNGEFVLCEDCVYYRCQDHIVSVCFDPDDNDPKHLFIYPDFSLWDYPKYSEINKKTQVLIQRETEKYLKENGYTYEYYSNID